MKATRRFIEKDDEIVINTETGDSTLGVDITGTYVGTFRLTGSIGDSGQRFDLKCYKPDGSSGDINGPRPNTVFADLSGFTKVRLTATDFTSGEAIVNISSSVSRKITETIKSTESSSSDGGSSEGGATAVQIDAIIKELRGVDTNGDLLPPNFDSYPTSSVDNIQDNTRVVTRQVGSSVYEFTYGYDANSGSLISESGWVKQ